MKPSRDEEGNPPGRKRRRPGSPDQLIHERHEKLSGSAAHVSPPGGGSIDEPYDLTVEHGAHPVLARHERRKRKTNHETHHDVPASGRDKRHAEHRWRRKHDKESAAVSWPQKVANC
ncbi:hypothetical protein PanWU01x14_109310, partial [Parasponia andersonii]